MKKYIILIILMISICTVSICALNNKFTFDDTKLSFTTNSKKSSVVDSFNDEYNLTHSVSNENSEIEEEIKTLTKKTTYLLLGDFNNDKETSEQYYKRHQDYLDLRYAPNIPKDENTFTGLDEDSQEYKDDLVSGLAVPSLFLQLNELGIIYKSYGDIRVTINDNMIISSITLPNIKIKEQNSEDPMKYDMVDTNLVLYYYFKKLDNQYKLYYLFGETTDSVNEYFNELEESENKNHMAMASSYDSNLSTIYSYEQLNNMTDNEFNKIYNSNINNIVYLNSYYNNLLIASANGFFINDGLIVTTWNFLEKSLINAQYLTINDSKGNSYEIDGIVTANPETDVVVIKTKNKSNTHVTLGNSKEVKTENPAITISSKTGTGLVTQKGIIISTDDYIQTSIPLTQNDEGSPLFDKNGKVIGINTAKSINTSISIAVNSDVLNEIQTKFSNTEFDNIKTISFEKLKEEFYYIKYNEENIKNSIPINKWKQYSKIGNIEENIKLELVKASYKDGIVSLRYKNNISNYIQSMQLAAIFKEQLIKDGYKEKLNSTSKCIYQNEKYQIIIMDEFDYLIIVMVKL